MAEHDRSMELTPEVNQWFDSLLTELGNGTKLNLDEEEDRKRLQLYEIHSFWLKSSKSEIKMDDFYSPVMRERNEAIKSVYEEAKNDNLYIFNKKDNTLRRAFIGIDGKITLSEDIGNIPEPRKPGWGTFSWGASEADIKKYKHDKELYDRETKYFAKKFSSQYGNIRKRRKQANENDIIRQKEERRLERIEKIKQKEEKKIERLEEEKKEIESKQQKQEAGKINIEGNPAYSGKNEKIDDATKADILVNAFKTNLSKDDKAIDFKVDDNKVEEKKAEENKVEEKKAEGSKAEEKKAEGNKNENKKPEAEKAGIKLDNISENDLREIEDCYRNRDKFIMEALNKNNDERSVNRLVNAIADSDFQIGKKLANADKALSSYPSTDNLSKAVDKLFSIADSENGLSKNTVFAGAFASSILDNYNKGQNNGNKLSDATLKKLKGITELGKIASAGFEAREKLNKTADISKLENKEEIIKNFITAEAADYSLKLKKVSKSDLRTSGISAILCGGIDSEKLKSFLTGRDSYNQLAGQDGNFDAFFKSNRTKRMASMSGLYSDVIKDIGTRTNQANKARENVISNDPKQISKDSRKFEIDSNRNTGSLNMT